MRQWSRLRQRRPQARHLFTLRPLRRHPPMSTAQRSSIRPRPHIIIQTTIPVITVARTFRSDFTAGLIFHLASAAGFIHTILAGDTVLSAVALLVTPAAGFIISDKYRVMRDALPRNT